METALNALINDIKDVLDQPRDIQKLLVVFSQERLVLKALSEKNLENGTELYRDESGFALFAYSELAGRYREPHNHGDGWVIYSVVAGEVEMGSFTTMDAEKVMLKDKESLKAGDCRLYKTGEIHDTRCLSSEAIILRFTSCDLKVEVKEGRMRTFKL